MRHIRQHLTYANAVSTLALFLVLAGGSAVALNGSNTVFSDDIKDNEVKTADVRNDTLAGGGLGAADLQANSVGTTEVAANSLNGADINESGLGTVPNANKLDGVDSTDSTGFLSSGSVKKLIYEAPIGSAKTNIATVGPYTIKASCLVGFAPDHTMLQVYANGPAGTFDYRQSSVINFNDFKQTNFGQGSIPASTDTDIVYDPPLDIAEPNKVRGEGTVMLKSGSSLVQVDYNGVALAPPNGTGSCYLYGTAMVGT
jgi:hypothetical protein